MADAYNKFTKQSAGTLLGNWQEERELRELTGHGRNYPIVHVPRHDGEPEFIRNRDGTDRRIHGVDHPIDSLNTFNSEYGRSTNPADRIPRIGKREQLLSSKIYEEIQKEHQQKLEDERKAKETREFSTTTSNTFSWKVPENSIGKRVMKDQHGNPVSLSDPEFAVEHGFRRIQPRTDVSKLQEEVRTKQIEVTFYSDTLHRNIVPVSSDKGANPFARTSGFTQPIQLTRGANSFQGNI